MYLPLALGRLVRLPKYRDLGSRARQAVPLRSEQGDVSVQFAKLSRDDRCRGKPYAAWEGTSLQDRTALVLYDPVLGSDNARLYLKRGELQRLHRDWDAALADYNRASELAPDLSGVHLSRGRMWFESGRFSSALTELDRFLFAQPGHAEGLLWRARALVKLGNGLEAAEDYTAAIARLKRPTPEYFLERARALVNAGDEYIDEALRGLDEGIVRLGSLVTLQQFAIELELKQQRYEQALARLDRVARWMARERFLQQQGAILEQAGRSVEARQAFSAALAHIESLRETRRSAKPIVELQTSLRAALGLRSPDRASPLFSPPDGRSTQ